MEELKCEDCGEEVTEKVGNFSKDKYEGKVFCFEHQKNHPKVETFDIDKVSEKKEKSGEKWQDDMINFETLLNKAHEKFGGKLSIETSLIEQNMEKKFAVFKALVRVQTVEPKDNMDWGSSRIFEAHGDANQENCGSMIKPHFLRMAETRAIARALRWATNNAQTAEEEKE